MGCGRPWDALACTYLMWDAPLLFAIVIMPMFGVVSLKSALLREKDVLILLGGVARSTLRRWESVGLFPRRVVLSRSPDGRAGRIAWRRDEVLAWLESRPRGGEAPVEPNGRDA